jgi:hypothetical protein
MNKIISFLVAALFALNGVAAFTNVKAPVSVYQTVAVPSSPFMAETSTSLNLKIKIDPEDSKTRVNPGAYKGAAYVGSIAVAVLLPVVFLIWSSIH